jgi:cobalt/nickel transport system permease protein
MHIPDGFIDAGTSAGAAVVATGGLGASLRRAGQVLDERRVPLAGMVAAFVFAAQMLNFPVAAGTSGHLLGGTLAAVLVGPAVAVVCLSVVLVVQALLFADGGLSALGLNVLNIALVATLGGYATFVALQWLLGQVRGARRSGPSGPSGASDPAGAAGPPGSAGPPVSAGVAGRSGPVVVAAGVAAGLSVVLSAGVFAVEYALGGAGGASPGTVAGAMLGVHVLIGVGEGIITALVVSAVLATRPDLVWGARHWAGAAAAGAGEAGPRGEPGRRGEVAGGATGAGVAGVDGGAGGVAGDVGEPARGAPAEGEVVP